MAGRGNFYGTWEQSGSRSQQYNAKIQNHYHRGSKDEKIATTPVSTIPFLRNPNFVKRLEYRQLDEKLSSGRTRVALTGFGGAGKSQLAIEYCHRAREIAPDCWVFWIHASSPERLDAGIRELADVLQLPGRDGASADVLRQVEKWLRGSGKQWLLVLDNADLEDVLFKPVERSNGASRNAVKKRPIDFLAVPSCGQTILTTRHKKVALRFVDECDVITVGPMIGSDAIKLFRSKAGEQYDPKEAERLFDALGCVPLAIAHASAFMRIQVPSWPIQTYLNKFEETIKSDASLLTVNYNELRRDPEANNSVINTWQVSFEHIRQIRPSAADRLSLMSFYDHRSIPRSLLGMRDSADTLPKVSGLVDQYRTIDADLDGDIVMLWEFHLISVGVGSEDLEVHPLVQLAARKWLKSQDKEGQWLRQSIQNLRYTLTDATNEPSLHWAIYPPHVQLASTYELEDKASGLILADICGAAVENLIPDSGQTAQTWARRSLFERARHLGIDHISTLGAELRLIWLLREFGGQEERLEAQVMQKHCSALAGKYLDLDSDLGPEVRRFRIYYLIQAGQDEDRQGHLADAGVYLRRALGLCYEHPEHDYMNECIGSLVTVLLQQEKQSEAESICRQALEVCIERDGSEHHHTLDITARLADVLFKKGKLAEALEMYNVASKGFAHIYGLDHIATLEVRIHLAKVLLAQEKMQAALDIMEDVYRKSSDRFGRESMYTLSYADSYAIALEDTGRLAQALDLMKTCTTITQRQLGPDHEHTLIRARTVARLERELRRKRKREKCVVQ